MLTNELAGLCNLNETEAEMHFLFRCTLYNNLRHLVSRKASETHGDIFRPSLTLKSLFIYLIDSH